MNGLLDIEFHCKATLTSSWRKTDSLSGKAGHFLPGPIGQITGEGRAMALDRVRSFAAKYKPDALVIDLEYGPAREFDASAETRARFAKFAGLSATPSKEEINGKYMEQWVDFCCRETVELYKLIKEGVKAGSPDTLFGVYSAYQSERNKKIYAVDWNYFRGVAEFGTMGYGMPGAKLTQDTLKAFDGMPANSGILIESMKHPAMLEFKTDIVRRIVNGYSGVMFWTWKNLDGLARTQIAAAAAVLAEYEEFFLAPKHIDGFTVDGSLIRYDSYILEKDGKQLLIVFNTGDSLRKGQVTVDGRKIPVEVKPKDLFIQIL